MRIFGAANPFTSASKFFALDAHERTLILEAARVTIAMRAMLWLLPFARVQKITERMATRSRKIHFAVSREEIVLAVGRVSNAIPFTSNCLVRAMAAKVVLARHGYAANLRFGVAHPNDGLKAHAWLECDGQIVIGDFPSGDYAPLGRAGSI